MKHRLLALPAVAFVFLLSSILFLGCNVGSSSNDQVASFRILHASPDSPALDVLVDGLVVLSGVNFGESSGYLSVDEGSRRIRVIESGSSAVLIDVSVSLKDGVDYTFLIANYLSNIEPVLIEDGNTDPKFGEFKLRFIHAAPGAGALDVYVTGQDDSIVSTDPDFSRVPFAAATEYLGLNDGEYRVRITPTGTKVAIIDTGSIRINAGQIRTVVSLDSPGGGAPYRAILLQDKNS